MFIEKLTHDVRATPAGVECLSLLFRYFYKHATSLRSVSLMARHCYKYLIFS